MSYLSVLKRYVKLRENIEIKERDKNE